MQQAFLAYSNVAENLLRLFGKHYALGRGILLSLAFLGLDL